MEKQMKKIKFMNPASHGEYINNATTNIFHFMLTIK